MVEVSAGRLVGVVYHSLATVVALALLVQFFRKRNEFFLKTRFPYLALVLQVACICGWFSQGVIDPFLASQCYVTVVFQGSVAAVVLISHVARGWGLYWRVFLMQHLARTRALLKREVEHSRAWFSPQSVTSDADSEVGHEHSRLQVFTYRVLRYAVIGYFGALLTFYAIYLQVEYFTSWCGSFPLASPMLLIIFASSLLAAAALRKSIGAFRDNSNVYVELRRTAIAYFVIFSYFLGVVVYITIAGPGQDGKNWLLLMEALPFYVQAFFVICNVFPLKDQYELDKKVPAYEKADTKTLDDVLGDPVSHTALKNVMYREFCGEMLEFYDAVHQYQSMYDMWSREKRVRRARTIFVQFIQPGAPSQINVSGEVVEKISACFGQLLKKDSRPATPSNKADVPKDVFDDAQRSITRLILIGPFLRFQVNGGGEYGSTRRDKRSHSRSQSRDSKRGSHALKLPKTSRDRKNSRGSICTGVFFPAEA